MSTKSKFKEALERRVEPKARRPAASGFPIRLLVKAEGEISKPVDVARVFAGHGLSLRRAHAALQSIAAGKSVAVELFGRDPDAIIRGLNALGVSAAQIRVPDVNIKRVRERFGLSQAEFATRFGFEVDTIQNWEQGRNAPDGAAKILLAIIESSPEIVEAAITGSNEPLPPRYE